MQIEMRKQNQIKKKQMIKIKKKEMIKSNEEKSKSRRKLQKRQETRV